MSKRTKTRSKRSVQTKGFRITKVHCCYTCINAKHEELITCELTTSPADWLDDRHLHPVLSPIGICDEYKLRKGISASDVYRGDNINKDE